MGLKIPQTTSPLVKFIRSGEGVLIYVFGVVLVAVPIITSSLPPALADSLNTGKWLAIVTVVCRTGLKTLSLFSSATGIDPTTPAGLPSEASIEAEIEAVGKIIESIQQQPGTPAEQVQTGAGLAADLPTAQPETPATQPPAA